MISLLRIDFIDISSESITFVFQITRIIADINQFASFFRILKAKNKLKTHEWQVWISIYSGSEAKKAKQNKNTMIHQKMSNYIQNMKRIFDMSITVFFHVTHFTHFLECWYHLLISNDMLCGNGAGEKGAELKCVFICEPKPNANDYFMWQSPDSWILKLAMTE